MNLAHILPMLAFFILPAIAALYNYYSIRKMPSTLKLNTGAAIINSAVAFALAYNIIFFIQELFLVLGKNWIGLKAVLYHNNHNWFDAHPKDDLMQGSGAAAIFICGIIFLFLQPLFKKDSWSRVFVLWLSFNGFLQSLPQFATAKIAPDTDTGQAFYYLGFNETMGWVIMMASYLLMIVLLIYFGRKILQFSPDNKNVKNRFLYIRNTVMFATLLSIVLIFPFRIFPLQRAMAVVFLVLVTTPIMTAFSWKKQGVPSYDNIINKKILIAPIIALILLLVFFQAVLAKGIVFNA